MTDRKGICVACKHSGFKDNERESFFKSAAEGISAMTVLGEVKGLCHRYPSPVDIIASSHCGEFSVSDNLKEIKGEKKPNLAAALYGR